ncbi:MAG TPA: sulfurtransferase TusA family protein [Candidatus Tenderia electrophaga]|uniref:Sulfurtransferase TusA family protein n=1 Tax=Candidatus Tenderia electrophaga TaxID=1748243 RepID=A0A832J2T7_9GAMM|nr:sulfurtransferase TusA family protein [Candidatus Tenderia electrophaga]
MSKHSLDVTGQLCPIPVIRTQNKAKKLAPGDTLEVLCTDPGVINDIPAWCRINGHTVVSSETREDGNLIIITLTIGE